jgi:regulator of protease activity HflC (stomatin/prohibitin superfamily)
MGLCFLSKRPRKAILKVEKFNFAITQLAQAALRDVCGKVELDTILSKKRKWEKH